MQTFSVVRCYNMINGFVFFLLRPWTYTINKYTAFRNIFDAKFGISNAFFHSPTKPFNHLVFSGAQKIIWNAIAGCWSFTSLSGKSTKKSDYTHQKIGEIIIICIFKSFARFYTLCVKLIPLFLGLNERKNVNDKKLLSLLNTILDSPVWMMARNI